MSFTKLHTSLFAIAAMFLTTTLAKAAEKDIVETAQSAGKFNTLLTAAKAAGLVDTLKSKGPLTVFAPTDEAFAKIPAEKLNAVLKNKELLTAILKYHVVPGKVMASEVVNLKNAKTALGKAVGVNVTGSTVRIGNAKVIKTDIECSNGVIHVIDTVLLPPQK